MPCRIRYDRDADAYLEVTVWGLLTPEEFAAAGSEVRALAHEWCRVLIDATELENPGEAFTLFMRAEWRGQLPRMRQAAVIGPKAAAVARSWVRLVSVGSGGTQAFAAREPALDWLLAEYQTVTGGS